MTTLHESYKNCEREVLNAWVDYEPYRPMLLADQAIIISAASRLLHNMRQRYPKTHGMGGSGALEAALKTLKYLAIIPAEFAARRAEREVDDDNI